MSSSRTERALHASPVSDCRSRALSIVSELVAAPRNCSRVGALVITSRENTWLTIAAMRRCWLPIRAMSDPSPTLPCRARANLNASSPDRTCCPADSVRPVYGSYRSLGMQMSTPPMALTIDWNPPKSTTTKWSIVRPVFSWIARPEQAAADARSPPLSQPIAKASLIIACERARVVEPSDIWQDGIETSESRGMETSSTRCRSADTWTTIVVSARMPAVSSPSAAIAAASR